MKTNPIRRLRLPALAFLASLALGSATFAQDTVSEPKKMQVKIIRTIDGKTTVTDTTITATSDANDIRKILGQQHPFFYQNTQVTPICRKAEPGRTPDDAS